MASAAPKPAYATEAKILRFVKAAKKAGLDVAGFDALPDGTVRILEARAMPQPPAASLFDQLEAAGKL